eukprot:10459234-Lingulodinium_polyedra.AAC.1
MPHKPRSARDTKCKMRVSQIDNVLRVRRDLGKLIAFTTSHVDDVKPAGQTRSSQAHTHGTPPGLRCTQG